MAEQDDDYGDGFAAYIYYDDRDEGRHHDDIDQNDDDVYRQIDPVVRWAKEVAGVKDIDLQAESGEALVNHDHGDDYD